MLSQAAVGFGSLALASLLADESRADESTAKPQAIQSPANPLAPKPPHFMPRAKRVIFLFMKGGPSHVDTFDPKPLLTRDDGQPLPFAKPRVQFASTGNLLASPWKFAQHGQSGLWVSELFPQVAAPCGRPLHDPLGPWHQPGARRGAAQAAHRQRQFHPPQHRLLGQLRPGHGKRQPTRPSSRSAPRWPTAASTTGAPRSCRPCIRARRWATPASRPIRPASNTSPTAACRRRSAAAAARSAGRDEPRAPDPGRPGAVARGPHQFIRAGLPHADGAAARSKTSRRKRPRRASCMAWTIPSPPILAACA